jgi:hypothetical protein
VTVAILTRVRLRLHQLYDARPGVCWACRKPWPCPTYRRVSDTDPQADQ